MPEKELTSLDMPDEEFLETDPSEFEIVEDDDSTEEGNESEDGSEEENDTEENESNNEEELDDDSETDDDTETDDDSQEDGDDTEEEEEDETSDDDSSDEEETSDDDTDGDDQENESVDFEAEYKKVFAPFKANGKEFKVDNADEAISLMQMGANYIKKMSALKPHLKLVKMLEKNDLLGEDKISNLIDLSKKDPKAIANLVKESGMEPLDINTDGVDYTPSDHSVSDAEYDLDQAIDDIRGNESFEQSMDVMGKIWDEQSRNLIAENPSIVAIIDNHVQSGVYEKAQAMVTKDKSLGKLIGVPDIIAYRQAIEKLNEQGEIEPDVKSKPKANAFDKNLKKKKAAAAKKKKKAAAPSKKSSAKVKRKDDENYLDMPDEDFTKKYN